MHVLIGRPLIREMHVLIGRFSRHSKCASYVGYPGNLALLGWLLWKSQILNSSLELRTQLVCVLIKKFFVGEVGCCGSCHRGSGNAVMSWMDPRGNSSPVLHYNTHKVSCSEMWSTWNARTPLILSYTLETLIKKKKLQRNFKKRS